MAKPDITEKEAQRIEKERQRRAKEKKKLYKQMVKEIKGSNRRRVKTALSKAKEKEQERRRRVREYKKWVKEQHQVRRKQYQIRQAELARRERSRQFLLLRKRKLLVEQPGNRTDFILSLGLLSGLFGFFAVVIISFFFGASLSAVLFFGLAALLLFAGGGAFIAHTVGEQFPGFHRGEEREQTRSPQDSGQADKGVMVDAVVGDEDGTGPGNGKDGVNQETPVQAAEGGSISEPAQEALAQDERRPQSAPGV